MIRIEYLKKSREWKDVTLVCCQSCGKVSEDDGKMVDVTAMPEDSVGGVHPQLILCDNCRKEMVACLTGFPN